jgi:hypothetical protein
MAHIVRQDLEAKRLRRAKICPTYSLHFYLHIILGYPKFLIKSVQKYSNNYIIQHMHYQIYFMVDSMKQIWYYKYYYFFYKFSQR